METWVNEYGRLLLAIIALPGLPLLVWRLGRLFGRFVAWVRHRITVEMRLIYCEERSTAREAQLEALREIIASYGQSPPSSD